MRSSFLTGEAQALPVLLATQADPAPYPVSDDDQDSGDLPTGVDEDALDHDELDTDQLADPD